MMVHFLLILFDWSGIVLFYSLFFCLVFFFFKQKTAYEMRISDWSSDVCSSDLGQRAVCRDIGVQPEVQEGLRQLGAVPRRGSPVEIGRASCRERVCQYV